MDSLILELSHSIKRVDAHPLQMILYSQDLLKIPRFLERFVKNPSASFSLRTMKRLRLFSKSAGSTGSL